MLKRDLLQHAIAVLVGAMPSGFSIASATAFTLTPPKIPAGVPSELLQRRPDIARAERQMAAANASIGVSRAAFYPNVTLSGIAGFEDNAFRLADLPNSLWSVGRRCHVAAVRRWPASCRTEALLVCCTHKLATLIAQRCSHPFRKWKTH